ncbi:hypothetical protein DFH09DRAFT_1087435 [Mycena vulgaris]|nr:hypothetical protein DFH09DRAFT_1087435 [Mycena vulgaris]
MPPAYTSSTVLRAILHEPCTILYDADAARKQRNSADIVIFCPSLGVVAKIAWPMVNGLLVPAHHLRAYLNSLGLHWSCFCALNLPFTVPPTSLSCRIVTWPGIGTFAFCHHASPRCQFFLNLNALYTSSTLHEPYFPLGEGHLTPDSHLGRYLLTDDPDSSEAPLTHALYLPGYLGERMLGVQLGKSILGDPSDILSGYMIRPVEIVGQPVVLSPDPLPARRSYGVQVESPYASLPTHALNVLNIQEANKFIILGRGAGISEEDAGSMLSSCPKCRLFFVDRLAALHTPFCTPVPRTRTLTRPANNNDYQRLVDIDRERTTK